MQYFSSPHWRKWSDYSLHAQWLLKKSLFQRPHSSFPRPSKQQEQLWVDQCVHVSFWRPLFPPRYTIQLNGRADAGPFPALRQGTMLWNMDKDLVGEEGREPSSSYKMQSYFNLTVWGSQRLQCSSLWRLKSNFTTIVLKSSCSGHKVSFDH